MTSDVLAIAGVGSGVLFAVAIVILVFVLRDLLSTARASDSTAALNLQAKLKAEAERDGFEAQGIKWKAERDDALARLAAVEKQRNAETAKESDDVAKEVAQSSPVDAAAIVNRELASAAGVSPHVPRADSGNTASKDRSQAGPDALLNPFVTEPSGPQRHPGGK